MVNEMQQPAQDTATRQDPAMQSEQNPDPEQTASPEQEVHERFVINVMKLASGEQYDKVMAFLNSGGNAVQSFGRALFFILEAVKTGLEKKGVEIPGQLWLAENGIIEQSAKIIGILAVKAGVELDKESMSQGIELAAQAIAETDSMKKQQAAEGGGQPDPAMQQAPQQAQSPQQPMQPPQQAQGGLISKAGAM